MKKIFAAALVLLVVISGFSQDLQSPEQFLGYKVGTRFTRHHKLVEYFRAVAQAKPDMVKLEKYGETNEGRELVLAFIASPENLKRLETIRTGNLSLTGLLKDKSKVSTESAPAIVWLSYNVHGNEASSSEAALLTLYALVDPSNAQTKEWLKNTVVVMDPCINPDGRDRYVNWYNSMVGKNFSADPAAREHSEPWPGGRSNHYNFDLNRDWAWQTQIETQQRLKKYNQWMPQVHVDFHEQEINGPYYFAPAADPYHEVITKWQKDFQLMIGKNNASYFDKKGWLFYTKERYDLLYPSYGDTYPIYNGSIGMTYEQAGGGRAGLGIIKADEDTLTLVDRAMHHHTTGLSTIETASRNRQKLMDEFKKYFDDGRSGKTGDYKTYVLTSNDENKIKAVISLLEQNGIEYGNISNKNFKGFNYVTGREDTYADEGFHVAVSAYQPKSVLAKVLLEPKTVVTDSNTYDITAWSVPYAFGVKAFGVKEKLEVSNEWKSSPAITSVSSSYGVLIPYQSLNAAKILAQLLKSGVKVRFAEKPFTLDGKKYDRGTLIIIKTGNPANWNLLANDACKKYNVQAVAVETGFMDKGIDFGSPDVKVINSDFKVAMLAGDQTSSLGAGEVWHFFEQQLDFPLTLINAADIGRANLKNFQALILPNGNYRGLSDKAVSDKLKDFVRGGGKIIAIDNAVSALGSDLGIKSRDDKQEDKGDYAALKKYADRENQSLTGSVPGAIYKLELDNTHPLAFGYPDYYFTLQQGSGQFEFIKDGWNVGVMKKDAYVAGFVGSKVKPKIKDALLLGVQDFGGGHIIYFAEDPLFRSFWENGKLLLCNAVFLVGH